MSRQNKDQKVDNFRLALIEDRTHKQIWALRFTRVSFLITIISIIVVICLGLFSLIAFTPIRTFIPGYPDAHTKHAAIRNAIMIDSLENIVGKWELYSENLSRIVDGKEPIRLDSLIKNDNSVAVSSKNEGKLARKDSMLRSNVKEAEQFDISDNKARNLQIEGMHFFVPLKGVISQGYDKVIHPYIDITAPANSVVMATLDGTVIFSGWDDETGYTIQLQHANNIVSIYKHNQILLKKTGDKVSAGTPIALVGNSGSLTTGDHLHFELWYKGEAVDPTQYINF
jgi:murein DD-endopeptidase MepM/ murein hydrolase activator NlpD